MIGTFRKHSQAMWWVIIVAIIITFVYWGSSTSRTGGGGRGGNGNYGIMNGEVITPAMLEMARREVRLRMAYNYFFSSNGRWPGAGENVAGQDLDLQTYQRLFMTQKAREMGVQVNDDAVMQAATGRMRTLFGGKAVPAADFEREVLARDRLTLGDFERYIRNELAIEQLMYLVTAGAELLPPAEVEKLYRREFQPVEAQVVFFRGTTNLSSIATPPEAVSAFYSNYIAQYRKPERVQIGYVAYPLSNYLSEATTELAENTNLNEFIEVRFEQLGMSAYPEAKTPDEAKQKIRDEFQRNLTIDKAAKDANKFDNQMYDRLATNYSAAGFAAVAQEFGLKPEVTAPFAENQLPAGLDVNQDFVHRAFALTPDEPFSEPLMGKEHVYVIAYSNKLPSEIPTLESIQDQVKADYQYVEAKKAAQQESLNFFETATNGLAAGQAFSNLCAAAGKQVTSLSPFSPATRVIPEVANQVDDQRFRQTVFSTQPGHVTPPLETMDGALLAFVQARLPVDESAMSTNLPAFTREVEQMRRNEVFQAWFRTEGEKALSSLPYFQRKTEMSAPQPN